VASESREERVADLIRAGQKEMTGEDVGDYFAPDFAFHGPGGFDADYEGLQGYFAAVRAAFDDLNIRRGIIVAEGDYIACQTWISGPSSASSPSPRLDRFSRTASGSRSSS
jgi:SnoaL-like domain